MAALIARQQFPWSLTGNQRLAWYSPARAAFVIGNHADKCILAANGSAAPMPLVTRADGYAQKTSAYDDQLPPADFEEVRKYGVDGFQLLTAVQYDAAFAGEKWGSVCPVDQALISGLTCKVPVLHPTSGAIVSMADKKLVLHSLEAKTFATVAEAKLRGPMTAIQAAPSQPVIYYGTNAGDVYSVAVLPDKLGPQKKVGAFGRVVNSIRHTTDGQHLIVGGMGFVAMLSLAGKAPEIVAKLDTSCRSIHVLNDRWLLLNQGMHGLTLCEMSNGQLRLDTTHKPTDAVDRIVCSTEGTKALLLFQPPAGMALYDIQV